MGCFAYAGGYFIGGWSVGIGVVLLFLAALAFYGVIEEHWGGS